MSEEKEPTTQSRPSMFSLISSALAAGDISSRDAKDMRSKLGISQSFFTRNQTTKAQRKRRRKEQVEARRRNRVLRKRDRKITRGQKKSGRM